jgi:shikimate dehydrogenase
MTISGRTRVYGLVGDPVFHSLSPRLCNAAFAALGADAVYVAFAGDASRPADLIAGLTALGVSGVNVTYPLKSAVLPHLAAWSPAVQQIGAANVLVRQDDGSFRGENTDAPGLVLALRTWAAWEPAGTRAVIVGAGGAARAAAHGLLEAGVAEVVLLARDVPRATADVASLAPLPGGGRLTVAALGSADATTILAAATLLVHATPVGLDDPDGPALVDPAAAPQALAFELNYGTRPTALARAWHAAGRPCLDGRDLLTAQASLALECWLGCAPDLHTMRRSIGGAGGGR